MANRPGPQNTAVDPGSQRMPLCSLPKVPPRDLSHISNPNRARLIVTLEKVWVNGTRLTYYFFKTPAQWRGAPEQEQAVREAFTAWKDLGIGLEFEEVQNPEQATIRIGFDHSPSEGSWSYVGRDCVDIATDPAERTTNFGWDLTTPYGRDTALHELGHVLGFPHEHQNPLAGIVWNEEAVYESLGGSPNNWSRETTYWNIIRKIPANTVDGSNWDKDSIMHYQFQAGLIDQPAQYRTQPLVPAPGLSQLDVETARRLYPQIEATLPELLPYESRRFAIEAGQQLNFLIRPALSKQYTIQTFGNLDTVMVLFESVNGSERFISGDDDSGLDYNAQLQVRLQRDREYILRVRLYYAEYTGSGALMMF